MLICPKCGNDNELGRIFCHQCGDRLDISSIKPPSVAERKRRLFKAEAIRNIRFLVNLVILGVLILVVALICLTPPVVPTQSSNTELVASDTKRMELDRIGRGKKGGQVTVTEAQLNAFFNQRPFRTATGAGIELTPIALRIHLNESRVQMEFLGATQFGSYFEKKLYLAYEGQPILRAGKFGFKPTGGWIGRLPVHPLILRITSFFESRFGRLFNEFSSEKELLDTLTAIDVTQESVTFVRAASPAH